MTEYLGSGRKKGKGRGILIAIGAILLLGGLGALGLVTFRTGDAPTVELTADKQAIGKGTLFKVSVAEPKRGLTEVQVVLQQAGRTVKLAEHSFAPQPPWGLGPMTADKQFEVLVGRDNVQGLIEGEVTIVASVKGAGTWLKAAPAAETQVTLPVRLVPPTLEVRSRNIYPAQGGCEVVIYKVGKTAVRHGVEAGDWFFPGYPLPGGTEGEAFALFSVPYDHGSADQVRLFATDDVDNELRLPFVDRFTPRPFATDTIRVSRNVMERVVKKILGRVPAFGDRGDLVKTYVAINSEMRKQNNDLLVKLSKETKPEFLWNEPFAQMSAKAVSQFADRRTYYHEGAKIDRQDHLGFDLASTRRAPIPAANSGLVVYADYLGIYGNTVVIDHGYGLMSLYAHLSEISVKVGDRVERAQTVGRTGATGLALGDHLHFTIMLHGLPVTPLEWWDGHWIRDRLALKLGDALGFVDGDKNE